MMGKMMMMMMTEAVCEGGVPVVALAHDHRLWCCAVAGGCRGTWFAMTCVVVARLVGWCNRALSWFLCWLEGAEWVLGLM